VLKEIKALATKKYFKKEMLCNVFMLKVSRVWSTYILHTILETNDRGFKSSQGEHIWVFKATLQCCRSKLPLKYFEEINDTNENFRIEIKLFAGGTNLRSEMF
jgi:hypothetical protein